MSYLAVKRVKGRYYAYRQESYREGGRVRTRTVEYLGAIDPGLAGKIKSGEIDSVPQPAKPDEITKGSIRDLTPNANPAPPKVLKLEKAKPPSDDQVQMIVNGEPMLVDKHSGEIVRSYNSVITTENHEDVSRPFDQSLQLPDLKSYGVSTIAMQRTHQRYGNRLRELQINPSHMSDVKIEYGHPSGFKANKDGSYSVVVSRKPERKRHPINKTEMWKHYRSALSHSYLDAIENGNPRLFEDLRLVFDYHYGQSQKLALEAISLTSDPLTKLTLSLQLKLWNRLPAWVKEKATPEELGQINLDRQGGWRDECAQVLAEVQKSGWEGMDKRVRDNRAKLKSRITQRLNVLQDASMLGKLSLRLSGKRWRLFREIREAEIKLQAVEQLEHRLSFLRSHLPP